MCHDRYYGYSIPVPSFSTENMKFLSSQQALADLANFVGGFYEAHDLCPYMNRLITFGGSYPGMLSAFSRQKYPHLVFAAVAASAPVMGEALFTGYMDVVSDSLAVEIVGGSPSCQDSVTSGFSQIGSLLKTDNGRSSLAQSFNVCKGASILDSWNGGKAFTDAVLSLFPLQTNDITCKTAGCSYGSICSIMLAGSNPVQGLADVVTKTLNAANQTCFDVSIFNNETLRNTSTIDGGDWANRVWQVLACSLSSSFD